MLPGAWGGAIEIAILSEHFRCEVASFDIQSNRVDLYGEGNRYGRRVYLIYDGFVDCACGVWGLALIR